MARFGALRVALRLGRRDAWRNRGRSALVAVMVALPVMAAAALVVTHRSDQYDPQDTIRIGIGTQAQAGVTSVPGEELQQSVDGSVMSSKSDRTPGQSEEDAVLQSAGEGVSVADFRRTVESVISDRNRLVSDLTMWSGRIRFGERVFEPGLREFDYTAAGVGGLVDQVSGRAPAGPGEVVVSRELAEEKDIGIGARLIRENPAAGLPKTLTVVGIVGGLPLIGDSSIIGGTGSLISARELADRRGAVSVHLLVTGPDPVTWDQVLDLNRVGGVVQSRSVVADPPPEDRVPYEQNDFGDSPLSASAASTAAIAAIVIGLGLLQIALMAGPAIAVGARRNQRSLAILASTGAERKHLRAVVLATNGVIGVVASLAAVGVGAGIGAIAVLVGRRYFDQLYPRVDLHVLDLLGLVAVGGLTAVGAALIPARQTARMDVVAALTGRRGQLPPRLGVPLAGLVIFAIGAVLAYLSSGWQYLFLPVAGLALAEIGLIAASGTILALVGRLAVHLPFALRFALRDAARQRGRTTPAVAAVLAAVAGGSAALVSISALIASDRQDYNPGAAPGVVWVSTSQQDEAQVRATEATVRRTLPVEKVLVARAMSGSDGWSAYAELARPPAQECPYPDLWEGDSAPTTAELKRHRAEPRCVDPPAFRRVYEYPGSALFDDGSALQAFTGREDPAAVAALRSGRTVISDPKLLWPDGTIHVTVSEDPPAETKGEPRRRTVVLPAQVSTLTPRMNVPVFPPETAKELGVTTAADGLIVDTTRLPTSREEDTLAGALPDAYIDVERGFESQYPYMLLLIVAVAGLVTLAGSFTAVGLAAAEGRADVATLAAIGAGPGTRRRLVAGQAGVISGLGTALGVISGVLAGWVLIRVQKMETSDSPWADVDPDGSVGWTLILPWQYLLGLGLGLPLLVVAVGFLTARSQLPLVRRLGQ